MITFIQFFLAHLIGDFFIQPNAWVKSKEQKKWRSPFLYLHVLTHFCLLLLLTGSFTLWKEALIIAVCHLIIDAAKLQFQKDATKRTWFFADQGLHLLSIAIVWGCKEHIVFSVNTFTGIQTLTITTAVLFLMRPASFIIKTVISRWVPDTSPAHSTDSLENAGQLIGIMERLMVLIFVLLNQWEGVGFLLAAKSVFRFGDLKEAKDMKLTEYVLIGTFLSFGLAILTGLIALKLTVAGGQ